MNELPQHSQLLISRLLDAYCARICPPLARNTVLIDYRVEGDRVVIHELRRILGVAGTRAPVPIARFRYRSSSGDWLLDYFEEGLWRRYRPLPRSQSFLELLREFDLDSRYGPCVCPSRRERWERAARLGLNPPQDVLELLESGGGRPMSLFHGRV